MERGWLVNSSFSRSEGGAAVGSERSYQISPIACCAVAGVTPGARIYNTPWLLVRNAHAHVQSS